jgi:hypothetical protein
MAILGSPGLSCTDPGHAPVRLDLQARGPAFRAMDGRARCEDLPLPDHAPHTMAARRIIPDRGEFIDALRVLRKGRVLVQVSDISGGCMLDGAPLYSAHRTLLDYGLIREFHNPQGFPSVRYYRLSERGRDFADRACESWRRRPLLQRLAVRLAG